MAITDQPVLVTGGGGFIGSHLVEALADGRLVRVLDDFSTGSMANLAWAAGNDRVEVIDGDLRDRAALRRALAGVGVVYHLACRNVRHSLGHPVENHEVNATGTLLLLQEARQAGVRRFVHVSSSEVYGTARTAPITEAHPCWPETVYGASKLAGEMYTRAYCQTYGLPGMVIRPFNNFGPRSHHEGDSGEVIPRFVVWALNGQRPVIFGDGLQTRDFIYVKDTVYWLCRAAGCDELLGQTVNLGSGRETSVLELARLVYEEVGRPDLLPVHAPARPGDVRRHLAGSDLAARALGFAPQTSLRDGIRAVVEYFKSHPAGLAALAERARPVNWANVA